MKKTIGLLLVLFIFTTFQSGTSYAVASSNDKVTICHRTGNGGSHPITVSIHAVPAHLAHGDAIGDCEDTPE